MWSNRAPIENADGFCMISFFKKKPGSKPFHGPVQNPNWAVSPRGNFPRLVHLDPEEEGLTNASGVYVAWHGGLRPNWLYVGQSDNLAAAIHGLGDDEELMEYEIRGGLFVTWALIKKEFQSPVVRYLIDKLDPELDTINPPGDDIHPIPVYPPGVTPPEEDEDEAGFRLF